MRKGMAGLLIVLCCGAFLSGCAKKEIVKGEAAPTAPPPAAAKETPPKPPIKEEPVKEQPIKEAPVTSEERQPAAAGKAAKEEASLERIHFDFDSYILTQPSRDILYKNSEYLLKNTGIKVQIEGHCDERGSDEYNLALGEKRAMAAQSYLATLGVRKERLSTISYGKEKPLDPGHDEAAWTKNRRAEFIIMK